MEKRQKSLLDLYTKTNYGFVHDLGVLVPKKKRAESIVSVNRFPLLCEQTRDTFGFDYLNRVYTKRFLDSFILNSNNQIHNVFSKYKTVSNKYKTFFWNHLF